MSNGFREFVEVVSDPHMLIIVDSQPWAKNKLEILRDHMRELYKQGGITMRKLELVTPTWLRFDDGSRLERRGIVEYGSSCGFVFCHKSEKSAAYGQIDKWIYYLPESELRGKKHGQTHNAES